ncbi:MAG: hypothetical protein AUK47_28660 [Deltaproteobacteria bacterium CG2_30_63_29]|nr:MAG: hypothetical protein AUK47_28660 [Deltaproteobacteria bacterium CG2_30_63_29]PIV98702.1 MAG: hypothetical protein COW42_13510 [Deltaproteobacteria bacterium CG17_big_fil_post_rev_8_21_14_2_50_63_7]PJB47618.1 MAG: hypothetical protein CO108_03755 [Deltaproteobacteria bacterium CG_4_9_14_3_um_filter_63_12]
MSAVTAMAGLSDAQTVMTPPPEPEPRFIERVVDFMWTDGPDRWEDSFRARVYPRHPKVGDTVRVSLKISRTRNGKEKKAVEPLRVDAFFRQEKGGQPTEYSAASPGNSIAFEHPASDVGAHTVSLVTHYTEEETYTVAIRYVVEKP